MDPTQTPPSPASPESAPTDTQETTTDPAPVESKDSSTARSLFDEPNPVFSEAEQSAGEENIHAGHEAEDEAKLAAEAQDPPPSNTPISEEAAAAALQQVPPTPPAAQPAATPTPEHPVQSPPIVNPVAQQPAPAAVETPAQQKQQSPEEIQRSLNVYSVTEKDYDAIFDTEDKAESIKALNGMLQNAVRQAVTMSNVLVQEEAQKLTQTVQPYMQFADQQRTGALHQEFYAKHKDLASAEPVVDAVLKQFQASGTKFDSTEQLFDAVAQNTKAYLQQLQQLGQTVVPTAPGPAQTQRVAPQRKPAMAALPSGGQNGAGTGGSNSGKVSTAQALFG